MLFLEKYNKAALHVPSTAPTINPGAAEVLVAKGQPLRRSNSRTPKTSPAVP